MFVICESQKCGKTPCIASIDDDINIDKFNECFYSTVKVKWRKATTEEYICMRCARCRKENKVLSQLQQQNEESMEALKPFSEILNRVAAPEDNHFYIFASLSDSHVCPEYTHEIEKATEVYNKYAKS